VTTKLFEPRTCKEALSCEQAARWIEAMAEEMQSMQDNCVMVLEQPPDGRKAIPTMMIFKVKYDENGMVKRFKARLVAKGFMQQQGRDYVEVWAPVGKYPSLRAFLAMAAAEGMHIHQLDVKTAFLNADLEEEIYITLPAEVEGGGAGMVYRLRKAIYGLKQAPRAWYKRLRETLEGIGFSVSDADPALFIRNSKNSKQLILCHVDDMLIASTDLRQVEQIKAALALSLEITDLGSATCYLGMEIQRSENKLLLTQRQYTAELLDQNRMTAVRVRSVPLDVSIKLSKDSGEQLSSSDITKYRALVGAMMYLGCGTRPDIAFAVGALARFFQSPTTQHWDAAMLVLRYLASTRDMGIEYGSGGGLQGYADADFAGNVDNRRSTTGYVFTLNGGAVSWGSKLQPTVAVSTTEAEYMAAGAAVKEALFLRKLGPELGLQLDAGGVSIRGDNTAALALLVNPISSERSKHIDVLHHFARERALRKEVVFSYIATQEMVADALTKALVPALFIACREGMGVKAWPRG
jgi:hypothetical protein